ncbi:MAG: family F420-dependent class oxidoreductase [Amycolatopsis sp.]|jgi:probable F420-dependent oxidoreductase|uniref:LLM class flavin-dependent oxidoreductase n=1 Tax=Amycolatopsis sp. TaxID=37632 RepID=UPI00262DC045|nr:LLM class flavin-dependent oxidoreductase [Amycolatopsis sp.]MCU1679551.1 family F420-dependent class oxidoreductase [Amycolatopsis sp.]
MKVGLNTGDIDTAIRDARAAEALGFDYLGCGEHLFFHGPTANAFVQLAAAAGATSHIRLVSSITLLPLYNAPLAAKLAATLDRVSGGRFELGVGAGGEYPPEFEAAGVDPATRFRRLDESLRVLRSLFTGNRVSFEGEFTTFHDVALEPAPTQSGGPPIWLGGRKGGAIRRAGRLADVWMPYLVEPERLHKTLQEVRAVAADAGRAPNRVSGAVFAWTCVDEDGARARRVGVETVSSTYNQDFTGLADRYLVLGTPDQVADRLQEYADSGADRVLIQLACPPAERERVVETFAREVLPRLRLPAD